MCLLYKLKRVLSHEQLMQALQSPPKVSLWVAVDSCAAMVRQTRECISRRACQSHGLKPVVGIDQEGRGTLKHYVQR